jgi:hypothetical protein
VHIFAYITIVVPKTWDSRPVLSIGEKATFLHSLPLSYSFSANVGALVQKVKY